jgi:hypothetical protein
VVFGFVPVKLVSNTANYSPKPPGGPVAAGTEDLSVASESPKRRGGPIGLLLFLAWNALGENRLSLVLLLLAVAIGVGFQIPNRANLAGFRFGLSARSRAPGGELSLGEAQRVATARALVHQIVHMRDGAIGTAPEPPTLARMLLGVHC